jgi:hypothetical protein
MIARSVVVETAGSGGRVHGNPNVKLLEASCIFLCYFAMTANGRFPVNVDYI